MDQFTDSKGYTPLMLAAKIGLHDVVNYLSLRGYNLNQEDPENKTLLLQYIIFQERLLPDGKIPRSFQTKLLK
jgi:ankyrin repeat protein